MIHVYLPTFTAKVYCSKIVKPISILKVVLLLLAWSLALNLHAQSAGGTHNAFNSFLKVKGDPTKVDQAISYADGYAKRSPASFQYMFHNFFAQDFDQKVHKPNDIAAQRTLLECLVGDTSQVVAQAATPISLWVQIQETNNSAELNRITGNFIATQLTASDLYENRIARYALLIYQLIRQRRECETIAQSLLSQTTAALNKNLSAYIPPANASRDPKRAWYRYLYGSCNFLKAEVCKTKGEEKNAARFYRLASDYSPDALDENSKDDYFYDMGFLFGDDKKSFKEDYIQFLSTTPQKDESLKAFNSLAISDATQLSRLKSFYIVNYPDSIPFGQYWKKALNEGLPIAPDFTLKQVNNHPFSLNEQKGKWILIDFWGTWCSPCLKEMPQMQQFYREVTSTHQDKLTLLAVACKDTEAKVKTFLSKHSYSFPVAMSDTQIEKDYSITAYPTKILITPEGNRLVIPAGEDWVEKVKLYCQL